MFRSLSVKLPVFFVLISVVPLILVSLIWFITARDDLIKATSLEVEAVSDQATSEVEHFFTTKLISLIIHSQTQAFLNQDAEGIQSEMNDFLLQDSDIRKLMYLDTSGNIVTEVARSGFISPTASISGNLHPAFRITTFLGGSKFVGQVYGDRNNPVIDIAVPVVAPQFAQSLQDLSTSAVGDPLDAGSIRGVMIETMSLNSLWDRLNQTTIGDEGYVFVVDDKGIILNHPEWELIENVATPTSEVTRFIESVENLHIGITDEVEITKNEQGIDSLTTHRHADLPNWGIIAQIPLSEAFQRTSNAAFLTGVVLLISTISVILLSLFFASRIISPIRYLQHGVEIIGNGNFHERLKIRTGDEIEQLAESFNKMAVKLQNAFLHISEDKNIIASERNKLSIALSSISDAVIVLDKEGRVIVFNKAAETLTGYSENEAIGALLDRLISISEGMVDLPFIVYAPPLKEGFEGTVFTADKVKIKGKNSHEITVTVTTAQIREGVLTNVGNIIILHDITKEAELEQMKLDFVSMAAHELRTPLTSIRGYMSVFLQEYKDSLTDEQKLFLGRIYISSHQLLALVENLLNVSKIERGIFTISKLPTDWNQVVAKTVTEYSNRASEKGIKLHYFAPQEQFPQVFVDRLRVTEVLSNLLSNSIHYTPSGGKISVWLERQGNMLVTHVQDSGKGIPKDALPRLFNKFFRVSATLESGSKGTGLGLYIAKSIVELHRGKIWVVSEEGKGSTFSFSLPIYGSEHAKS